MTSRSGPIHAFAASLALGLLTAPAWGAEPEPAPNPQAQARSEQEAAQTARLEAQQARQQASHEALEAQLKAAREQLDAAARHVAELSAQLGDRVFITDRMIVGMPPPRALLGVQLGASQDRPGALVQALSPGGAAEQAGIRVGDVIVAIDGKDLTKEADPGRALADVMRTQEPDRKVKLRLIRDGRSQEFEVTPHPAPRVAPLGGVAPFPARPGMPAQPLYIGPPGDIRAPGVTNFRLQRDEDGNWERRVPLAGMELATLSEGLGRYFGAKEGVLVVRAGGNDAYKLQDGDVILSIDGRVPNSAAHATRILRSYQRGEKLQMRVLRDRKTVNLDVTLPGG